MSVHISYLDIQFWIWMRNISKFSGHHHIQIEFSLTNFYNSWFKSNEYQIIFKRKNFYLKILKHLGVQFQLYPRWYTLKLSLGKPTNIYLVVAKVDGPHISRNLLAFVPILPCQQSPNCGGPGAGPASSPPASSMCSPSSAWLIISCTGQVSMNCLILQTKIKEI